MKSSVLLLSLITLVLGSFSLQYSAAQVAPDEVAGFELNSRTVTFGTGVITSGLDARWTFSKGEGNWFALQGNAERAYFVRTYPAVDWLTVSGNVGQFSGVPWSGIRLNLHPTDNLTVWLWHEWSAGTLESGVQAEPEFFARSAVAFWTPGPFTFSAAVVDFKPVDYLIKQAGVKYSYTINESFGVLGGVQYEFTKGDVFFQVGIVRTF